jgi:hypothetical protein
MESRREFNNMALDNKAKKVHIDEEVCHALSKSVF